MDSRRSSERCHHRVILRQIGLHSARWREKLSYGARYSCSLPRGECTEPRVLAANRCRNYYSQLPSAVGRFVTGDARLRVFAKIWSTGWRGEGSRSRLRNLRNDRHRGSGGNNETLISKRLRNNEYCSRNASSYSKKRLSAPRTDYSMGGETGGLGPVISGP